MASDSLNQVGKYIRQTRDTADRAIQRNSPVRPPVERTRDIFDDATSFTMYFDVTPNQKIISLDLEFTKPPPLEGCLTGTGLTTFCEGFTLDEGDHEVTTGYKVISSTVSVFVNGTVLPDSKWAVISVGNDENGATIRVLQLPLTQNTLTICYISNEA